MMYSVVHRGGNDSSDDDSTADLFSPIFGRLQSLDNFDDSAAPGTPGTPAANGADILPRLADNSWIGARVSPIPSANEEDTATAPYRKAMREFGATERSALLGRRIHPMWKDDFFEDAARVAENVRKRSKPPIWGRLVMGGSMIHLFCIGIHDFYLWYLQIRRGFTSEYPVGWALSWVGPSARILLRFGAFCPGKMIWQKQWYRILTPLAMVTSLTELAMLLLAWWQLERVASSAANNQTTERWYIWWPVLHVSCVGMGQLWMTAFCSYYALSGCAGWGTCGVLCATGVCRPDYRMPLFFTAIALVLINMLQPTSNFYGAIGASFFGWAMAGTGFSPDSNASEKENYSRPKKLTDSNWFALGGALIVFFVPVVYILLWREFEMPPDFDSYYLS